ncbi:MAG: trimethylamine methyltransferase family protein [Hyphomicrobiaceae bacterium]
MAASEGGTARRARRQRGALTHPPRSAAYRRISNPFPPIRVFSDDQVEHMHEAALGVLETIGMRVLSPEARACYRKAGAKVDESRLTVRIDRGMVEKALQTTPRMVDFVIRGSTDRLRMGGNHVAVATTGGAPHISSIDGGKRNGTLADFRDLTKLAQSFDVLHVMGPGIVEAQDVELQFRHLGSCMPN